MNRYEMTTLDKLVDGDRFYKVGDRKKKVMAVFRVTSTRSGGVDTVAICLSENFLTGLGYTTISKPKEYRVVFLRHEIDIA